MSLSRLMRCALSSRFRPSLPRPTTKKHVRSFSAWPFEPTVEELLSRASELPREQDNREDDYVDDYEYRPTETDRAVEEMIALVAKQAIAPQHAIQCITSLAKDQTESTLLQICATLWDGSVKALRKSKDSAISNSNLLVQLSRLAQEDFEPQPKGIARGPIMVQGDSGHEYRLWRDMPGMWELLDRMYNSPSKLSPNPDYQDCYFFSLLFRSRQHAFDGLDSYLAGAFWSVAYWPVFPEERERWKTGIQAILTLLNTAGARMKENVLDSHPNERLVNVGQWRRWQVLLFRIAADEMVDLESRALAKRAADMMNIEKHLTNHWWRRWRRKLSDIVADPGQESYDRVRAKRINGILASENEEQEAATARTSPMPQSSPLQLPPPPPPP